MLIFFLIAGVLAGFAFPAFFIKAIRSKDDDTLKPTLLSCLTFGLCVLACLIFAAYPYV